MVASAMRQRSRSLITCASARGFGMVSSGVNNCRRAKVVLVHPKPGWYYSTPIQTT